MSDLSLTPTGVTMNSDELLGLINEARTEAGEPSLRRNKLAEKIEDELAGEHYTKRVVQNLNSTESAVFDLTRDQCMLVAMRESKSVRRRVVAKLNELEAKLAKPAPAELSHLEILQLAIESGRSLIKAEAEREQAIRDAVVTVEGVLHGLLGKVSPGKVLQVSPRNSQSPGAIRNRAYRERKKAAAEIDKQQIGSKREADAMAKASAATLEVQRLKGELGRHAEHATVIAVERATGKRWPKNTYVALRRWCRRNNAMPVDVLDERYGTVKSWPAGAWLEAYGICLDKLFPVAPL